MADKSLKIVGAGVLGVRVAVLWKQKFPDAIIYLKTRTDKPERSAKWKAAGFVPLTQDKSDDVTTPYVVFSAPAVGSDYGQAVVKSVKEDFSGAGNFVFTSSGGVYVENSGKEVDETSAVAGRDRTNTMHRGSTAGILEGEKAVEAAKGISIRFGGLYTKSYGVHHFWLKGGRRQLSSAPNGFINLIHYDDAARAVVAALVSPKTESGRLYLAGDGAPIRRTDICQLATKIPEFKDCQLPEFVGDAALVDGKKYDSSKIKAELGWKPVFESFDKFASGLYTEEMHIDLL